MITLDEAYEQAGVRAKKKIRHREWTLQTKLVGFVREFCAVPHEFAAHDRSYDKTGKQHLFEAQRGIRADWLDTELVLLGGTTFRCELKWGKNKVDDLDGQHRMIKRLNALGHPAIWVNSVVGYMMEATRLADVQWHPGAAARAKFLDEWLIATFAKPRAAAKSKPRAPRASQRALRVGRAAQRPK